MRYLAIDHGLKRTGLAVCDPSETIVSALSVIEGSKDVISDVIKIVEKENIESIVIGLPLNMDGTAGGQAKIVRAFAEQLNQRTKVDIYLQDERLSSFAASEKLDQMEMSHKMKKKKLDALAAAQILEAFLEQKKMGESS